MTTTLPVYYIEEVPRGTLILYRIYRRNPRQHIATFFDTKEQAEQYLQYLLSL